MSWIEGENHNLAKGKVASCVETYMYLARGCILYSLEHKKVHVYDMQRFPKLKIQFVANLENIAVIEAH